MVYCTALKVSLRLSKHFVYFESKMYISIDSVRGILKVVSV